MKGSFLLAVLSVALIREVADAQLYGLEQALPVIEGKPAVAVVNGEPVPLDELLGQVQPTESGRDDTSARRKQLEVLNRLVNIKLLVQEGRKMGLDELPEVRKQIETNARVVLRDVLMERKFQDVKADEKAVERLHKELVRGWKTTSLLFAKEEDAKKALRELEAGATFEEVKKRALADGSAKTEDEESYHNRRELLPAVSEALAKMEIGSVGPIIPITSGFVVLKLVDIRYVENEEARKQARQTVLQEARGAALGKFEDMLISRYAVIEEGTLAAVDYDAEKPGFQALLTDTMVLARIKGEKSITVGDLTNQMRTQFFHGAEQAAQRKRLNSRKLPVLLDMVRRRVFNKEAIRLGIDKTAEYKIRQNQFVQSLVFETFIQKAVAPDIKLQEQEIKSYFDAHIGDYRYPEMMRIKSVAFLRRELAEGAIEKLRAGTDFDWLMANSEGRIDKAVQDVSFQSDLLTVESLPSDIAKIVSGCKPDDYRLYVSPKEQFHVLHIQDVVPSQVREYAEVRQDIAVKLFNEKLKKNIEEWADKLRALSDVKIFLKETD